MERKKNEPRGSFFYLSKRMVITSLKIWLDFAKV
jgi:hypothetical protein